MIKQDDDDDCIPPLKAEGEEAAEGPANPPKKQRLDEAGTTAGPTPPGFLFVVPVSAKRWAGVRRYNKRPLVDVREFYDKDGQLAPGAKGLSMSPDQWSRLTAGMEQVNDALARTDEASFVDLGSNKRAGVSVFSGKVMASLREYYDKDGQMLPGKKGISLPPDQWAKLCAAHEQITQALEAEAGQLPAPTAAAAAPAAGAPPAPDAAAAAGPAGSVSLAPLRRAEVTDWKGKRMVDVREFYSAADGSLKHSKKGIQLQPEQFATLRERAGDISAALAAQDVTFEVQLTAKRKVTISAFKGKHFVDLREYYEKNGQLAPGQRGISLPPEHWEKLCAGMDSLAAQLEGGEAAT